MDESKEQRKTLKVEMLEFVLPVALLKSTRQAKEIHDAEAEDFVEKELMDLDGHAVYPNHPFAYGQMSQNRLWQQGL